MNRKISLWMSIIVSLILMGCDHSFNPDLNKLDTVFFARVKPMTHGSVTVIPDSGIVGTEIKVLVNPQPGYKLEPDSLQTLIIGSDREKVSIGTIRDNDLRFQMMEGGVVISARFIPLSGSEHSVTVAETSNGNLTAYPLTGVSGNQIRIEVIPESGYALKDGSLQANGIGIAGPPYNVTLADSNIMVTAEFEKKGIAELVDIAGRTLTAAEYELAFAYYEAAYQMDPDNIEAIVYSSLGKMFNIIKNPKVRTLLKETGLTRVPANIDELLAFQIAGPQGYLKEYYDYYNYPDTDPYTSDGIVTLPSLGSPQGFPMGFLNYPIYQVLNSRRFGPDRELFDVLLFWNIVGNHPQGLNDFLNDSIKYIFGVEFNEAVARIAPLDSSRTVTFNATLRDTLKLDQIYGSSSSIGRAELEMILGSLYALKGLLEALASYDWESDLSVLKVMVNYEDKINNIIAAMLDTTIKDRLDHSPDFSPLGKILPFRNHFFREQNAGLMSAAKADFQKAVTMLSPAFESCYTRFLPTAQTKYQWLQGTGGMFFVLKSAMNDGGVFYLPEIPRYKNLIYAMDGKTAWVSALEAKHGINLDKVFIPGYMSVDKLVFTEKAGKAPLFYGFKTGETAGTAIAYDNPAPDPYDRFSFEISSNFKDVFVKINGIVTQNRRWLSELFPDTELTRENGIQLYNLYQRR